MSKGAKNIKEVKKEFSTISKNYSTDDSNREKIITLCREIIKPSKQAIYAAHRDDFSQSEKLIKIAEKAISTVTKIYDKSNLKEVGSIKASFEEYIEAKCYLEFVRKGILLLPSDFPKNIHYETYLSGIADFTGEITKRAIVLATKEDFKMVNIIKNTIEEIHELFLLFDFRSGDLRKKAESIKYNLSKVENILYDISMKRKV